MQSRENKSNNFLAQGGILALASILCRVIGLVYRIPLTRILGDEGNAFYASAFEIYNIALILSSYSLPLVVSKLISIRLAKKEKKNAYKVFKGAMAFAITTGGVIAIVIFVFAKTLSRYLLNSYLCYIALRVLAPGLLIVAILGVLRGYFQGYATMIPTALSQLLEQIINAVVSIIAASYLFKVGQAFANANTEIEHANLYSSAYGAAGGTLGTVIGALFALIFLSLVYFAFFKKNKKSFEKNVKGKEESYRQIFPILLATIVPVILSSVIYNICNLLDQSLFNYVMAHQGVSYGEYSKLLGIYTAKFLTLMNIPLAIANALASSSIPAVSTSIVRKNKREAKKKIMATIRAAMLVVIPSFVGYLFLASPILKLLFADATKTPAIILSIGSIMVVFYSISTITNAILQTIDKMFYPIKNAIISLSIHIIVLLFCLVILRIGIYSLVISNIVFSASMSILNNRDIKRTIGYKQEYKRTFIVPFIVAVIMGIICRICYTIFNLIFGNTISTILALIIAVFVYGTLLLKIGLLKIGDLKRLPLGNKIINMLRKIKLL